MAIEHVVRLPRSDSPNDSPEQYVLLHVIHDGDTPLDLKIEATEGKYPYFLELKHTQVPSLRSDRNNLSASEWEAALAHILFHEPLPDAIALSGLSASVSKAHKALDITIRTSVEKITNRLGTLSLAKVRDVFDVIHWTHTASSYAAVLSQNLQKAESLIHAQRSRIQDLETQLEELIAEKKKDEDELYSAFASAINTKKLKIRDQQRLLATAKIDPKVAAEVRALRDAVPKGISSRSRKDATTDVGQARGRRSTGKRKASADSPAPLPEIKDEPMISDESTEEEGSASEKEEARPLTPSPDESDASDTEMTHAPLPTRSATERDTIAAVTDPSGEGEDIDMQEPATAGAATNHGVTNGVDKGKGVADAKTKTAEDETNKVTDGNMDDDATDDEDDDDEL